MTLPKPNWPLRLLLFCLLFHVLPLSAGETASGEAVVVETAAVDPYLSWHQGRPAEALPQLLQRAERSRHWSYWYDVGLCAAAAEQPVTARLALLRAQRLAPWQSEPPAALDQLGLLPPPMWSSKLGPWAQLGDGWWAIILALSAGGFFAVAICYHRHAKFALLLGTLSAVALVPPLILRTVDAQEDWALVGEEVALLDASGLPQQTLKAGTLLHIDNGSAPQGQRRVMVYAPPSTDAATADRKRSKASGFIVASALEPIDAP